MAKATKKDSPVVQTTKDLHELLAAKQADLLGYRKGHATGELKNTGVIKATRKEIARIKTQLNGKEGDK